MSIHPAIIRKYSYERIERLRHSFIAAHLPKHRIRESAPNSMIDEIRP